MEDNYEEVFRALHRAVHSDPALQAHLFALGDANDFISAVCELARSLDHPLEPETVRQAMRNGHQAWHNRKPL